MLSPVQLFTLADHRRVVAGEFKVTYRLWKRPHVKAGTTYAAGFGGAYHIVDVSTVRAGDLTDADAWSAGSPDKAALLHTVGAHTKTKVTARMKLTRVVFEYRAQAPDKPQLPVDEIVERLTRLDAAAPATWTKTALELIERQPRTLARILAAEAGFDTLDFKVNVRKLKKLGLTTTHVRGYELTELGQAVLDALRARPRSRKRPAR
jgi:hypothetical protein